MYETVEGSISLSYATPSVSVYLVAVFMTYWDLLLRDDHGAIVSSYTHRGDVGCCDRLEGIFYQS